MAIRLPGLPHGVQAERICAGALVGDSEFELHGTTIRKGGRMRSSAVIVTPKEGFEFVPSGDHFKVQKKA